VGDATACGQRVRAACRQPLCILHEIVIKTQAVDLRRSNCARPLLVDAVTFVMRIRPIVVVALLCSSVRAQIVNVQGAIAKPPDNNAVVGQVELKLNWAEGNSPAFDASGGASVLWKHDQILSLVQVRGEYGTALHVENTAKTFEHIRERISLGCVWRWEAFVQHEYDQFRRLSLRTLVGTGPALQLMNEPDVAILAGATYMFEYEALDNRMGTNDAGARYDEQRASVYLTGREVLVENVAFVQTIYVQPRFDDLSNYRLLGDAALEVKLTKRVAVTDGLLVDYDSRPPQGVRAWDTSLKIGLVVTL
jgi:Protein of unknown function, DUF481